MYNITHTNIYADYFKARPSTFPVLWVCCCYKIETVAMG